MKNWIDIRPVSLGMLATVFVLVSGCSGREPITEKSFVGKWQSSKLKSPIYLRENGEWEIRTDDGAVLQYGVWQYKDKKIIWSYKLDGVTGHDPNPVLVVTPREFQVQERDRTTTTFVRLN